MPLPQDGDDAGAESTSSPMVAYHVVVEPRDVVFVKGLVEATDGLGAVFAREVPRAPRGTPRPPGGGDLQIVTPVERQDELRELLADLQNEIGAQVSLSGTNG